MPECGTWLYRPTTRPAGPTDVWGFFSMPEIVAVAPSASTGSELWMVKNGAWVWLTTTAVGSDAAAVFSASPEK